MSETLLRQAPEIAPDNPDFGQLNAEQAAHVASFNTESAPQTAPEPESAINQVVNAEAASEPLNPDRASARLMGRIAGFLERRATSMADRRTTKQFAQDKKDAAFDFTKDKFESTRDDAKKVATRVGVAVVVSASSGLDNFDKATKLTSEQTKSDLKFLTDKRDAAKSRIRTRLTERAERKEARTAARAERKEARIVARTERKEAKAKYELVVEAENRKRVAQAKERRAEMRHELKEQTKSRAINAAKFAGKAALVAGVGAAYGAYKAGELDVKIGQKTAELGTKGVRKSVEVAKAAGEITMVQVRHDKQAIQEKKANTIKQADSRIANTLNAYHDNQMRRHSRKAAAHQSKVSTVRHAK